MKRIYLTFAVILLCSPALACDSFEECMKPSTRSVQYVEMAIKSKADPVEKTRIYEVPASDSNVQRAIAFKLDEISKKLDVSEYEKTEILKKEQAMKTASWKLCYDTFCQTNDCPAGHDCYRTLPCKPCEGMLK